MSAALSARLPVTVRVPGSSANLGPGFDTLGLALQIYLEARVEQPAAGEPLVRLSGSHVENIATDESNLVLAAFHAAFKHKGRAAPPVCLELRNAIPLARGLGSSGAAAVAGVMLADEAGALGLTSKEKVLLAAAFEQGHPDNVAASC